MSTLSGTFSKSTPGLPRGRTSLDPARAEQLQRSRLLRAVISAVAEDGYEATSVAEIVRRARVSRSVMYREFTGKQDCFLASIEAGRILVSATLADAFQRAEAGDLEDVVRSVLAAYLDICAAEPDHTRAWVLELPAVRTVGIDVRNRYLDGLAGLLERIDVSHGSGEARSAPHYLAVVGAITEIVSRAVHDGWVPELPTQLDTMTRVAVLLLS